MGNSKELLLIHSAMEPVSLTESVNVMLTPQFYTLKREALPLKFAYQAKRIAPSLFEGLLEEGRNYEYYVLKEKEGWAFIAYDIEQINRFLTSKGIKSTQVSKIFFAQQSSQLFDKPIALGSNEVLTQIDDTVVVVPSGALDEMAPKGVFNRGFTPSGGVSAGGSASSLLSTKQAVALAVLLAGFGVMFAIEGSRYGSTSDVLTAQTDQLLENYPSLQSSYTRDGIATKYRVIEKKERKKREIIKSLGGMIFKGVTLTSMTLGDKGFSAVFACKDAAVVKRLETLAKKSEYGIKKSSPLELRIEGAI